MKSDDDEKATQAEVVLFDAMDRLRAVGLNPWQAANFMAAGAGLLVKGAYPIATERMNALIELNIAMIRSSGMAPMDIAAVATMEDRAMVRAVLDGLDASDN